LRIVAVELYVNGFEYIIPDYIFQNGRMQIRWANPDHTFIDDLVVVTMKEIQYILWSIKE
jgi:hypothetical protein